MKLNKIFAAFMLVMAVAFAACNQNPPVGPQGPGNGENTGNNNGDGTVTGEAPDTIGWNIPAECLTVAEANALCAQLESGATTGTKYYVKGWVKKLANKHADGIANYGNALFYMVDTKDNTTEDFYAFQVYGLNGQKITNADGVAVGDYVVIYGELTKYQYDANSTPVYETVGKGAAHIWKSTNKALGEPGTGSGNTDNGGNTGNGGSTSDSDITVPEDALVFDADADQGNATTDYNQAGAFQITKDGVTVDVTKGCLGTYNNEMHYRVYKNQTLTITSTAGNIKEIVFTCTGNVGDEKYGPDCFTADGGEYIYSGANGKWTGDASTVTFTASKNQLRATQIAVVVE